MTHWKTWALGLQDDGDVSVAYVGSLTQADAPIETNFEFSETAGLVYSEHVTVGQQLPQINTTSFNIKQLLDVVGVLGAVFQEGSLSEVGAVLYQAQYNDTALVAGSNHRRLRLPKAVATLGRLSCAHRGDASINLNIRGLFDGTNAPIIPQTGQALPALPASGGRWTLAAIPLTIGNSTFTVPVECATNVELDFGLDIQTFGCDSDTYDTFLDLKTVRPKLTITIYDIDRFKESSVNHLPLAGVDANHAQTKLRFRKRLNGQAGFVPDGTAEHIVMTLDGIATVTNAHSANANEPATMVIELNMTWDGTNAPIIVNTASAIT